MRVRNDCISLSNNKYKKYKKKNLESRNFKNKLRQHADAPEPINVSYYNIYLNRIGCTVQLTKLIYQKGKLFPYFIIVSCLSIVNTLFTIFQLKEKSIEILFSFLLSNNNENHFCIYFNSIFKQQYCILLTKIWEEEKRSNERDETNEYFPMMPNIIIIFDLKCIWNFSVRQHNIA